MLHKAKSGNKPSPGLAALVSGEAAFEEVVQQQEDNLHWIPSGKVPPNPLELLSSQRFKRLLQQLQADYEVIVIDCAPALAVSDALVLAQLVDALLYVVQAESTPCQAAEQGLKRLRRVNAPLLGVVLNQVPSPGRAYYGRYQRYYRYHDYAESCDAEG